MVSGADGRRLARPVTSYRLLAAGGDGSDIGVVAASFALPAMLAAVAFGRWSDRHDSRLMLVAGSSATAVAVLLLSGAEDLPAIAGSSALLGLGQLACAVSAQSSVAQRSGSRSRARNFGVLTLAASSGQTVGPLLGGLLVDGGGSAPTLEGTGTSLGVAALIALGAVPIAALLLMSRATREVTPRLPDGAGSTWSVVRVPGMAVALAASFGAKGSADLLQVYVPVLATELGISARTTGALLALAAGAAVIARVASPLMLRRIPPPPLVSICTALAAALVLTAWPWADTHLLAAALFGLGFLFAVTQTITMVWVVDLVDPGTRGTALGVRLAGNRVGQVAIPGVAGVVASSAGALGVFVVLGVALAAIAGLIVAQRRRRPGGSR